MTSSAASSDIDPEALGRSLLKLRSVVPEDASTAGILGRERIGNGIVIGPDGLTLTIGYLIAEASDVWLTAHRGREVAGHPLAYDPVTGFGLVLPLERLPAPALPFGDSELMDAGSQGYVLSSHEFAKPQSVRILARREFAGAWEYLLEKAIFTTPAHPHWSGAALIDQHGGLVGVGSLLVREVVSGEELNANMFVPIDLLQPILGDLRTRGRATRQSRPWLGVYAVEVSGKIYVAGTADVAPARLADIREGDLISHVADQAVSSVAEFYRRLWAFGAAGTDVPLSIMRDGTRLNLTVHSMDRADHFKRPQAH
jgi:S1-C subfamily serine protease